jgi:hypothetical protein
MISKREFVKNQFPTLCAVFSLIIATGLFGADSASFSLIISIVVLFLTGICAFLYADMRPTPLVLFMFVSWVIFTTVSFSFGYTQGAQEHYLMVLTAIAIFWLGQYGAFSRRGVENAWRFLLILGLMFSVFAFFQHVAAPNSIWGMTKPYHFGRLSGSFLSANTAATFLGIFVVASIAQIYRLWRISYSKAHDSEANVLFDMISKTVLPATTFLFSFVGLLLTSSRAGIAVTFCVCFLFLLWVLAQFLFDRNTFGNFRFGPALLLIVGFGAILAVFWNLSGGDVSARYQTIFEDVTDRVDMLKVSWAGVQYKPLFGYGLGNFNEAKLLSVDPLNNTSVMTQNAAHNFLAQHLVQVGIVGLAWLSIIYVYVMGSVNKDFRPTLSRSF